MTSIPIIFQLMNKGNLLQNDTLLCEAEFKSSEFRRNLETSSLSLSLLDHSTSEVVGELLLDVQYVRKRDWLLDSLTKHFDAATESLMTDSPVEGRFDPLVLSNNFRRFLVALTPIVKLQESAVAVFQWRQPTTSLFFALVIYLTLTNLYWVPLALVLLLLFFMTSGYIRRASDQPDSEADLIKNITFIQDSMGSGSALLEWVQIWVQDVVYWGNPDRASASFEMTIRLGLPVALFFIFVDIRDLLPYLATGSVLMTQPVLKAITVSGLSSVFNQYNRLTFSLWHRATKRVPSSPIRGAKKEDSAEKRIFRVYENQRLWLGVWKYLLLLGERGAWSDINGKELYKDQIQIPEDMEWADIWHIDGEDEGWEYAMDFSKPFHKKKEFFDYVRRRCWVRTAAVVTS